MQKILIVGATSAIAEATARLFAARGDALFLTGRDAARLAAIRDDLNVRGAARVAITTFDVADYSSHSRIIDEAELALGGLDIALIAHGTLSDQVACEQSIELLRHEFEVNGLATIAIVAELAKRMHTRGGSTLAVISSVAGDRGRQSNYVYGSAKAAVDAFLSGLRQRLQKSSVQVLTIKPGFVSSPMTAAFKKNALWAQPSDIAAGVVRAIGRRRNIVYLPWFWAPIMFVIRHVPEFVFKRLKL